MVLCLLALCSVGLASAPESFAAACCGGGFASPSIISSDDRAQLTSTVAMSEVVIDSVDSNGVWRTWDRPQQSQTLRFDFARIFWDRWQAGLTVPLIQRTRDGLSYSGLGDVSGTFGYEYLTDWDYNPWRPKAIGFVQLTLPTGKSRADSEVGGLDSRDNGFWAFGLGTLMTKNWSRWDAFLLLQVKQSFGKAISNSMFVGNVKPGLGSNLGLGAGFNFGRYRIGSSIIWTYEDPIIRTPIGQDALPGAAERFATAQVGLAYAHDDDWAGTLNVSDQTLFGSPINTSLGRTVSVQLQKRWLR